MTFAEVVLAPWMLWLGWLVSGSLVGLAMLQRPWQTLLADTALQHRWLAALVAVFLMWQLRAQAVDWLTLHLVFTALLTLIFKAPLALLSCLIVNVAMVLLGRVEWPLLGVNLLISGVVPALVMVVAWRLVDRWLADSLPVYVFVCGFFGTALATLASGLMVMAIVGLGSNDPQVWFLVREYARFLPLLMPSEAFITGMLLSVLVVYHPSWVATFSRQRYIDTK